MTFVLIFVLVTGLVTTLLVWGFTKRLAPTLGILTATFMLFLIADPELLGKVKDSVKGAAEPSGAGGSAAPSSTPSPSPTPSDKATPDPTSHASSPPPWEWIGFIALGLVAAAVFVLLLVLLTKALRRAATKRRIANRKAIEREKLHARHRAEWSDLLVKEKALGSRWLEYEDNPEAILRYPIMRQLNDPKVAPVVEAMGRAKAYRTEEPPDLDENPVETEYAKAVTQFEVSLDEAERYAKKIRWNNFTPDERKKAQQALNHLQKALDTRNYPGERRTAYERVAKLMEDLMIPVSPRALLAIEDSVGKLELTR